MNRIKGIVPSATGKRRRRFGETICSMAVFCILAAVMVTASGCSVYMASRQPDKKDLNVLSAGTPRSLVLAEMGQPLESNVRDGKRVDLFYFTQGYSQGAKAGRALFHGAADLFTLGMWEVIGTPAELMFRGEKEAYEVTYDSNDRVETVAKGTGGKGATAREHPAENGTGTPDERRAGPSAEPAKGSQGRTAYTPDPSKGIYKAYAGELPDRDIATLDIAAVSTAIIDDMHYVPREKYGAVKFAPGVHRIRFGEGLRANIDLEAGHIYRISSYRPSAPGSGNIYWIEDMTNGKILWEERQP